MAIFFPPYEALKDRFYSPNPVEYSFLDQLKKITEQQFKNESEFENIIAENSKLFFGNLSIFIDTKKK